MKQFEIKSGKIVASDPCYTLGTWCQGVIDNVRNGTWFAHVDTSDEGRWGKRIAALVIYHADNQQNNPNILSQFRLMPKLPLIALVESGQFGFFDHDGYRNDDMITPEIPLWNYSENSQPGRKFYAACCNLTIEGESWGILPFGAVSSSGFGDGDYTVLGEKNSHGEYIALAVIYIRTQDDDDLDEDDDDDEETDEDNDD